MDRQYQIVPFYLKNEEELGGDIQNNAGRWIADDTNLSLRVAIQNALKTLSSGLVYTNHLHPNVKILFCQWVK